MQRTVDVAIIGAGTAGLNAMGMVRQRTDNFVLINGGELGTTCARVGCMPSKALIQVSEDFNRRHAFERYGIRGKDQLSMDLHEGMEHVRDLRDIFVDRVLGSSTDEMPEDKLIEGYAHFLEPTLLEVNGEQIRANAVIIATGSQPIIPEAWMSFRDRLLTTDDLFEQETLPESIAVIGLGVIGLELGQALYRMGVNVIGVDRLQYIGGLSDPEVSQVATELFNKEFPLWLGAEACLLPEGEQLRLEADGNSKVVDKALVSLGRRPNLEGLNLQALGVPLDARGVPFYDPNSMQIGNLPVFIAGDVNADRAILHEAGHEGRIAGYNAGRDMPLRFKRKTPMAITFCDPNIMRVGLSWNQLDLNNTVIGQIPFAPVGRALIMGKNKGLLRVYARAGDGLLLGAEMIGPKGENLAHLLAWSIERQQTVYDLLAMPFYHPVLEEALQAALYNALSQLPAPAYPVELSPL